MNNKIQRFIEPDMRFYLVILFLFAVATFFFDVRLAQAELLVLAVLVVYSAFVSRKKRRELVEYIDSITYDVQTAKNDTLLNFPLPMVVFKLDDKQVVWGNQVFFDICGNEKPSFESRLTDLVPDFSDKWLKEGRSQCPNLLRVGDRKYQIHGNIVRSAKDEGNGFMGITYWVDVTEYDDTRIEFNNARSVVAFIVLDNLDELIKGLPERGKNDIRAILDEKITQWCDSKGGFVLRVERDRYLFLFENRYLDEIIAGKFSLVEDVHEVVSANGIHATVSIGLGRDGADYAENFHFANLSTEMALSRGGDQAVIKNRFTFEFFGGRGTELETSRTKVRSRVMANALNEMIADSSQVFVMGHKLADLDAIGGATGICCMARKNGKKYHIVVDPEVNASKLLIAKLKEVPEYRDVFITPNDAILMADSRCLMVVVDTNRPEQVEDYNLLITCNRVAVIDHHRRAATYIDNPVLSLNEPSASSVCELMTELLQEVTETSDILQAEAEAMLSGIVLDTKNFTIRTGHRTFDAAAFLRRAGADTVAVKKLLQSDFGLTVERYTILQSARIYRDTIAVSAMSTPQDRIVAAQAADELLNISGVEASIVLFPTAEGGVCISARSIGNINVQVLLEQLGGGGNNAAAGAQMKDIGIRDAVAQLFDAIDKYLED